MTAASGVVHEEFHSEAFTRSGGVFEVVQLWVNLPAREKMSPPRYQEIRDPDIPRVALENHAGSARVIAGELGGVNGPARTATPVLMWDARVAAGQTVALSIPDGFTALMAVRCGEAMFDGGQRAGAGELAVFEREGDDVKFTAGDEDVQALVLGGEPIGEPVVAQGPFVMNTREEIRQAIADYQSGRMGSLA
jgi:redox-sensitive bicupin YhaK (pirin superfamily)